MVCRWENRKVTRFSNYSYLHRLKLKKSVDLYIFPSGHQLSVHDVVMTPGEPDKG